MQDKQAEGCNNPIKAAIESKIKMVVGNMETNWLNIICPFLYQTVLAVKDIFRYRNEIIAVYFSLSKVWCHSKGVPGKVCMLGYTLNPIEIKRSDLIHSLTETYGNKNRDCEQNIMRY